MSFMNRQRKKSGRRGLLAAGVTVLAAAAGCSAHESEPTVIEADSGSQEVLITLENSTARMVGAFTVINVGDCSFVSTDKEFLDKKKDEHSGVVIPDSIVFSGYRTEESGCIDFGKYLTMVSGASVEYGGFSYVGDGYVTASKALVSITTPEGYKQKFSACDEIGSIRFEGTCLGDAACIGRRPFIAINGDRTFDTTFFGLSQYSLTDAFYKK